MKEEVTKIVEKRWDSNWGDSRIIEDDVDWIMEMLPELVAVWMRKFAREIEKPSLFSGDNRNGKWYISRTGCNRFFS